MRISEWSSDVCSSDLCPRGTAYDLSAGDLADNPLAPTTVCQEDLTQNYGVITPEIERFGFSGRVTAKIGDSSEARSEEHTSELQSLMRISYAVFCLKKKIVQKYRT